MIVTERIGVSDRGAFVAMGLAFALVLAGVLAMLWRSEQGRSDRPWVGADLHATFISEGRLFVSGHDGAAVSDHRGEWKQIEDLASADAMAWASTPKGLLVAGHTGIYESSDGGASFKVVEDLGGVDVHAMGGAGSTVYVSTPTEACSYRTTEASLSRLGAACRA